MRPRLELRYLWYFVAVAEELSFSRAAVRAGIAQPPLSQQIRQLERILGCNLFDRTGRRVRLTEAGAALLPEARRLLADAEGTATLLRRMGRGEVGALTIGFAPSTLYSPLPAAVRRFREKFPGVRVRLREIVPPEHGEMLRAGSVDVVLLREPEAEEGVAAWPILVERFVAALPAGHALAARPSLPVSALRDEPFVLFPREIAPVLYRQVTELCHNAGFEPKVVQEAHEWHTILSLVEAGLGVALVPDAFQERRAGALAHGVGFPRGAPGGGADARHEAVTRAGPPQGSPTVEASGEIGLVEEVGGVQRVVPRADVQRKHRIHQRVGGRGERVEAIPRLAHVPHPRPGPEPFDPESVEALCGPERRGVLGDRGQPLVEVGVGGVAAGGVPGIRVGVAADELQIPSAAFTSTSTPSTVTSPRCTWNSGSAGSGESRFRSFGAPCPWARFGIGSS